MNIWLLLPSIVLTIAALGTPSLTRRLHPALSVRVLTVLMGSTAAATAAWALIVVSDLIIQVGPPPGRESTIGKLITAHHPAPRWIATLVLASVLCAAVRIIAHEWNRRALHRTLPGTQGIVMTDISGFVGLAVPGRSSRIVLSRPALDGCTRAEQSVVVAHEWAHLRYRHSWYIRTVTIAATACPWLRPIERRVRFLIERWADEEAATSVRDRSLVARTIAKLALRPTTDGITIAFTHGDAAARARAMLEAAPDHPHLVTRITIASTSAAATSIAGSSLHLHHAIGTF